MSTNACVHAGPCGGTGLEASRAYCARLTKRTARNFYYGLRLLPQPKRSAMFALYAYMRLTDDIADVEDGRSPGQRLRDLECWLARTRAALNGGSAENQESIWPAFADMARSYGVAQTVFEDAIAGQRQDLERVRFETFADLREYCRRVAGVVGLASIRIWGFDGGAATEALAIDRGIAFQLTNILRDLREDAAKGRTYFPGADFAAFGLDEADLGPGAPAPAMADLIRFQIARAREYYARSAGLEERIAPDCRPTLVAMTAIYRGLLEKIARQPLRVLHGRVSLSVVTKLRIGWKATHRQ